jgi:hypothetical protein
MATLADSPFVGVTANYFDRAVIYSRDIYGCTSYAYNQSKPNPVIYFYRFGQPEYSWDSRNPKIINPVSKILMPNLAEIPLDWTIMPILADPNIPEGWDYVD